MIAKIKALSQKAQKRLEKTISRMKKKLSKQPELWRQQEELLASEISREAVINGGLCEVVRVNAQLTKAFALLRLGYPNMDLSRQTSGKDFRDAARIITDQIAELTINQISKNQRPVVALPWRSALAFASSYKRLNINNFYHLSSKRDEVTLRTVVDFEDGAVRPGDTVIIADPMLATGNTIVDTIERMTEKGVKSKNIIVNAVVAAPIGVARVKKAYPLVKIIVGELDQKLDERGYIVPGLGDFGDKYFAKLSATELAQLAGLFKVSELTKKKMTDRIKKQVVSEVLEDLLERDAKDNKIDATNREKMAAAGLKKIKPKKIIKIDTGKVEGVYNVAEMIIAGLSESDRIIAIEGESGTGKSSTAEKVKEELAGEKMSLGIIFRYLALRKSDEEKNVSAIINRLSFAIDSAGLHLMDGTINISEKFSKQLRSSELEKIVPEVAALCQTEVVALAAKQLVELSNKSDRMIIIEGRGYTLDYLPADLRVRLHADPSIRAERRWAEK